jgi:Protein of unknown function (DUF3489)
VEPEKIMTKPKTKTRSTDEVRGPDPSVASPPPKAPRQTKAALLRAKLSEPGGVALADLIEVTGWQAHTLRAALSGLRKEGLTLTRRREGENTNYAIEKAGSETSGPLESGT